MEKLLGYSDYDSMICFYVDFSGEISVWSSSSRATITKALTSTRPDVIVNRALLSKDIFPEYFALHSKEKEQLSPQKKLILSAILKYFKDLKVTITSKSRRPLETCQIIFVPPPLADWDVCVLRSLFWETGWITSKEDDSQFILVPFIEAHLNALQMSGAIKTPFERERKHVLLLMQPTDKGDKIIYTSIYFQMQCAKELIVLSKSLASGNFLLVPSIISTTPICLPSMDYALLTAMKAKFSNLFSKEEMRDKVDLGYEDIKSEIDELAYALVDMINKDDALALSFAALLGTTQNLKSYRVERILASLSHDDTIQQHTSAVYDFLKESLETTLTDYVASRSAPDGIHSILLSSNGGRRMEHHSFLVAKALLETQIIKPDDQFIDCRFLLKLHYGALQRPLKIRQIVNTILPPIIQNQEESGKVMLLRDRQEDKNTFLPVNSFYLQANIGERQIEFILNKVVRKPSSKTTVELFTAHERTIEMDDILTATSNILWNHYQMLESKGCLNSSISCCQEHMGIELSLGHYQRFKSNMTTLIKKWFQNKSTLSTEELDADQLVSINKECTCALKTTHRTLLETGLKPAFSSIAEIIVDTTLSNDHFGLYQLSAVFVQGFVDFIDNVYCADYLQRHSKEKTRRILQTHQRKLTTILVNEDTEAEMRQYMAKGNYTQISSSTYSISSVAGARRSYHSFGVLDSHLFAYKCLPGTCLYPSKPGDRDYLLKFEDAILIRGEHLPSTGIKKILFLPCCRSVAIDINIMSATQSGTDHITIYSTRFAPQGKDCYIAITILPLHHASKLRIAFSKTWTTSDRVLEIEEHDLVDIQERLFLKRNS